MCSKLLSYPKRSQEANIAVIAVFPDEIFKWAKLLFVWHYFESSSKNIFFTLKWVTFERIAERSIWVKAGHFRVMSFIAGRTGGGIAPLSCSINTMLTPRQSTAHTEAQQSLFHYYGNSLRKGASYFLCYPTA